MDFSAEDLEFSWSEELYKIFHMDSYWLKGDLKFVDSWNEEYKVSKKHFTKEFDIIGIFLFWIILKILEN